MTSQLTPCLQGFCAISKCHALQIDYLQRIGLVPWYAR